MLKITVAFVAGVMRCFECVVALSDSKDIEFPQPLQLFRLLSALDAISKPGPIAQLKGLPADPGTLPKLEMDGWGSGYGHTLALTSRAI